MNDPTYIEASRKLAERMMHEGGDSPASRIAFLFHLATAHAPTDAELKVLCDTFNRRLANYQIQARRREQTARHRRIQKRRQTRSA